jgi:uncharacterized metal-binding protein YceD (DUF177 family)
VNYLKDFLIPFRGLGIGVHNYIWELSHLFFEAVDNSDIDDASLEVKLSIDKQERLMTFQFTMNGSVIVKCDRCLEKLEIPVDAEEILYIKFGIESEEESDNVLILADTEYQINVSALINEYITLALPLRKVHLDSNKEGDGCNEDIIHKLEELSGRNGMDPRWEKLKNIKLDQ